MTLKLCMKEKEVLYFHIEDRDGDIGLARGGFSARVGFCFDGVAVERAVFQSLK